MPSAASGTKRDKKIGMARKVYDLLGKHKQIIIVSLLNVSSSQAQEARLLLRKYKGELVVGKNTVLQKAVQMRISGPPKDDPRYSSWKAMPELEKLNNELVGKVGLIFTDEAVSEIKPLLEKNKRDSFAKVGKLSPIDYVIPAGPTGLDPSQINFFHALQIPTKIQKSQIEITRDVKICTKGKKVSSSEAAFLQKLGHKPFAYAIEVLKMYDNGTIIGPELMTLTASDICTRFANAAKNITALSLELGIATEGSVYQNVFSTFKNILAVSLATGYTIKQFNAQAATAAPAAAEKKTEAKKEEPKKEEKKEEEEVVGGMDLFGGDDF